MAQPGPLRSRGPSLEVLGGDAVGATTRAPLLDPNLPSEVGGSVRLPGSGAPPPPLAAVGGEAAKALGSRRSSGLSAPNSHLGPQPASRAAGALGGGGALLTDAPPVPSDSDAVALMKATFAQLQTFKDALLPEMAAIKVGQLALKEELRSEFAESLRLQVEASKTSPKIERLEGVAAPLPRPSLPPLLPPPRDVHRLSGESLARSEQLLGK